MFDAVDEAIRNLLIREIPIRQNEIEIAFDQPTQDWSARVNSPTLNVYLHDIRENLPLRGAEQFKDTPLADGRVEIRRNPVRIDLHYLLTAWTKKEQDQHHLLGMAMMALLRNPFLPPEVCPEGFKDHLVPIPIEVAHTAPEVKWSDFWTTMNNRLRPGLTLMLTVLVNPYPPVIAAKTSAVEFGFGQTGDGEAGGASKRYFKAAGEIISQKYDPSTLQVIWEEKNLKLELQDGRFKIAKLEPGTYHLAIQYNDRVLKRHKFVVPLAESLRIEI